MDIRIENNAALTTVSGFGVLTSVTNNVTITDNTQLASCCGLLRIANNTVVPGGSLDLSNNAVVCNTKAQIETDCALPTIIDTDLTIASK